MRMVARFLTGLAALLSAFIATGQTTKDGESSLLWEISGKGLQKPSYLFGTIHLICPTDYIWTAAMKASLARSEKLCLEINMDNTAALVQNLGILLDPSKKLSSYFTAEQYEALRRYAKDSLEMEDEIIAYMKPVTMLMLMTRQNGSLCDEPVSYEENIMKAAKKDKKEVLGLETVPEQFAALETIPTDSIVKYVMESIADAGPDNGAEEYKKLVNAYRHQDITALQEMIAKSEAMGSAIDALLNDRNRKWIARMAGMMNGGSVFFAVGAGHLAGNEGVIHLLKQSGYKVTPLK